MCCKKWILWIEKGERRVKIILKQFGKVICYLLLFLGMQFLVNFVFQFGYGMKLGMELAVSGEAINEQMLAERLTEFLMDNANWITLLSGILTLFILWLFFKIRKKKLYQEAGICRFDKKMILPLIVCGVALSFFTSFVLSVLPIPESVLESYVEKSSLVGGGALWLRILSIVVVAPLAEEVIFRGLVLSRLKCVMPRGLAVVITGLIFGIMHGQIVWMAYAFVSGVIFAVVAEKTRSVGCAIVLHMAFNLVGIFGENLDFSMVQTIIIGIVSLLLIIGFGYYIFILDKKENVIPECEETV